MKNKNKNPLIIILVSIFAAALLTVIIGIIIITAKKAKTRNDFNSIFMLGRNNEITEEIEEELGGALEEIIGEFETTPYDGRVTEELPETEAGTEEFTEEATEEPIEETTNEENSSEDNTMVSENTNEKQEEEIINLSEINPFSSEYFTVNVNGKAPYAKVSAEINSFPFELTLNQDIDIAANGTIVNFTVTSPDGANLDEYAAGYGYKITSSAHEYTVSGLNISRVDEIPAACLEEIETKVEKYIKDENYTQNERDKFTGMKLSSYLFFNPTESNIDTLGNKLYLVYEVNSWNDYDGDVTYYFYAGFSDIIVSGDNYHVDLENFDTPTAYRDGSYLSGEYVCFNPPYEKGKNFYYLGYADELSLIDHLITVNPSYSINID